MASFLRSRSCSKIAVTSLEATRSVASSVPSAALIIVQLMHFVALAAASRRTSATFTSKNIGSNFVNFSGGARRSIHKMRVETDGQSNTITVHPEEGKHSASILLMHGEFIEFQITR